jgi:hypothetical protein
MTEEHKLNADEQLAKLKKQRHDAYRRWYVSPKGAAYRQKLKEKKALGK